MKTKFFTVLSFNVFKFGEQKVSQFILFESKYLFSIIFFYFHKSKGVQDRFHTHAFNAYSVLIFGNYTEELLERETKTISSVERNHRRILFIPKNRFHRITRSNGCLTMLLSGKWDKTWEEFKDNEFIKYNWNRKIHNEN